MTEDLEKQDNKKLNENLFDNYLKYGNKALVQMYSMLGHDKFLGKHTTAKGAWIYDDQDSKYLDLTAGISVHNIGHNHPKIEAVIKKFLTQQSTNILQIGRNPYHAKLLEKIAKITPEGLTRSFLDMRGADVVEFALKTARLYTKRRKILYLEGSYHGKTLGALSVTGNLEYQKPFSPLVPDCTMIPFNNIEKVEMELASGNYACIILEPIQGEGGIRIPSGNYLEKVRQICNKYETLMILDEIQTGLGRTGKMFACEYEQVTPDILLIGKAISGGYIATSVMVTTDLIWQKIYGTPKSSLLHSSTFSANALQCLVGYETLNLIEEEDLVSNAAKMGDYFLQKLQELKRDFPLIKEIRGRGLMIGIELEKPFLHSDFTTYFLAALVGARLLAECNIITIYTLNDPFTVRIEPPLSIAKTEIDYAVDGFRKVFSRHTKHEHFINTLAADLIKKQEQVNPNFNTIIQVKSLVNGSKTTINGPIKEMIDANSFLIKVMTPFAQVTKATNEVNIAALKAAKLNAEAFYQTPWTQRRDLLLKWQEKIIENYAFIISVAIREGLNYTNIIWQFNLVGSFYDIDQAYKRLNFFKQLLSPIKPSNDPSSVYYLQTGPGVVGIAPAQKTSIALGIMGITAAIHNGLSMIITLKNAVTFSIILNLLVEAFHEVGLPSGALNVIQTTDRNLMKSWSTIKNKDLGIMKKPNRNVLDFFAYWGPRDEELISNFTSTQIKCSFEMNGNDGVIVHHDAEIKSAIKDSMLKFESSGQICISPKRIFVHEAIKQTFLTGLLEEMKKLKISLINDPFNDIIPVFNPKDRNIAKDALKEAYQRGLDIYVHGEKINAATWSDLKNLLTTDYTGTVIPKFRGYYLRPILVVVDDENLDIQALQEEMFNTLLTVQFYSSIDEVIERVNNNEYGIRASFWTNDKNYETIDKLIQRIDCGGIMVNTPHLSLLDGSSDLGGTKHSSINNGFPGAKFMVSEFTQGIKYVQFQTPEDADKFIKRFWT